LSTISFRVYLDLNKCETSPNLINLYRLYLFLVLILVVVLSKRLTLVVVVGGGEVEKNFAKFIKLRSI